ncbi:MAG: phosphatase PAP2 family protein [Gemmatimonadetes bacterium]|nr:phosphatase PAP2 family protein [Gemmatimonadota bacterium]
MSVHRGALRRSFRSRYLLCVFLLIGVPPLSAQESEQVPDRRLLTAKDGYLALGAALGTLALAPLDAHIARAIQESPTQLSPTVRFISTGAELLGGPGSLAIAGGLYVGGNIVASRDLATTGLRTGEAVVLAEIIVYSIKGLAGRARPRLDVSNPLDFALGRGISGGSYQSFPSGHAAAAFAAATVLSSAIAEQNPDARIFAGSLLYTTASLTGISRIYTNEHWLTDTALGGAIGVFSAHKVLRYHRARGDDTRLDRWLLSISVVGGRPVALGITPLPAR